MKYSNTLMFSLGGVFLFLLVIGGVIWSMSLMSNTPAGEVAISPFVEKVPRVTIIYPSLEKPKKHIIIEKKDSTEEGLEEKKIANCEDKKTKDSKHACENSFLLEASVYNKDEKGCDSISDISTRKYCQDTIRVEKIMKEEKFEKCVEISTIILRKKCIDAYRLYQVNKAGKKEDCQSMAEPYKKQCLRKFLKVDDFHFSPSKCESIPKEDGDDRVFCQRMAMEYMIKNLQPVDCLKYPHLKEFCFSQQTLFLDKKLYKQAVSEKNIHYCAKIISKKSRTHCKDSLLPLLAFEKQDLSFCQVISTQKGQINCIKTNKTQISSMLLRKAVKENDSNICKKIPDIQRRKSCEEAFK